MPDFSDVISGPSGGGDSGDVESVETEVDSSAATVRVVSPEETASELSDVTAPNGLPYAGVDSNSMRLPAPDAD